MILGKIKRPSDAAELDCFYYPEVFTDVMQQLTITLEGEQRDADTESTIDRLLKLIALDEGSLVLDYGCGTGRLSKELIEIVNCRVVGLDASATMRALAVDYVGLPHFYTCSSEELRPADIKFDFAVSAWVLQHCLNPSMDIELIAGKLKPKAYFFFLGDFIRKVPIKVPSDPSYNSPAYWVNDGFDVQKLVLEYFDLVQQGKLNKESYWAFYQRKV